VLDEARASYPAAAASTVPLWNFYGYIYTQYGDYGRAVAAYEQAASTGGWRGEAPIALAHLYFSYHQYAEALATMRRYVERGGSLGDNDARFLRTLEEVTRGY
jgi:tetratricopeptide (TPR) repeat protein